jgi:hypothetical protein
LLSIVETAIGIRRLAASSGTSGIVNTVDNALHNWLIASLRPRIVAKTVVSAAQRCLQLWLQDTWWPLQADFLRKRRRC